MSSNLSVSVPRFTRWSIRVHWLSVVLVCAAFVLGWLRPWLEESDWDQVSLLVHRQLGLSVLALLVVRLLLRWRSPPSPALDSTGWLSLLATLTHGVLYALLVALPVLGWGMTNAQGHEVALFGFVHLPTLWSVDPDWADSLQEWHETAADGLCVLVLLHAGAALFHHWVLRDEVLRGMWPGLSAPQASKDTKVSAR